MKRKKSTSKTEIKPIRLTLFLYQETVDEFKNLANAEGRTLRGLFDAMFKGYKESQG